MQPIPPLQFLNGFGRITKLISGDDWGGGRPLLPPPGYATGDSLLSSDVYILCHLFVNSLVDTLTDSEQAKKTKETCENFLMFTCFHKTQPGQRNAENSPNFFEEIYSADVWVSRFGCRLKYLTVCWRCRVRWV